VARRSEGPRGPSRIRSAFDGSAPLDKKHSGGNITAKAIANVAIIHSASTRGERMMLNKIALALALAVTAITVTMSIPASANPKPGSSPESSSYQDSAYNRAGW
jgi:hypothetical protein